MGGFFIVNQLTPVIGNLLGRTLTSGLRGQGPYRPALWSKPALTSISIPGKVQTTPNTTTTFTDALGLPVTIQTAGYTPPIVYAFDAVIRAEHHRELRHTEHPVQTGATITDHAYLLPARVTLEIGMSDAMDSYGPQKWTGNLSKSVSAFQTLRDLQQARQLCTLTTRLDTYSNMLIESIQSADTNQTRFGLRAVVTFTQIFLAQVQSTGVPSVATATPSSSAVGEVTGTLTGTFGTVSARGQTTGSSPAGTVQTVPVPSSLAPRVP